MKYYLGLGGSKHDYATCLVGGGGVLAAIEEERLTRKKRGFGIPTDQGLAGVRECLDLAGISLAQVDAVFVNDLLEPWCYESLGKDVNIVGHHLTHAASCYYVAGFSSAAVLVADHSGGRWVTGDGRVAAEVVSYYRGAGDDLDLVDRVASHGMSPSEGEPVPYLADLRGDRGIGRLKQPRHSLGRFYARLAKLAECTSTMGDGQRHTESGKLMGLSAYGTPDFLPALRECYRLQARGRVTFRRNDQGFDFEELARLYLDGTLDHGAAGKTWPQRRADIAFAAQRGLEEMVLHCAGYAREATGERDLAVAGGTFLNGLANEAILTSRCFDRLFVQPAAHDAGTALGAAILGAVRDGQWPRRDRSFSPLLGRKYSSDEVRSVLSAMAVPYRQVPDPDLVIARAVAAGKIIGRFTGRSEFGPRALGNRSILADPRDLKVKHALDERIKYREPFRPYAPAVRARDTDRYFEVSGPTPHMLLIGRAKPEAEKSIPAVVHADLTVRPQEVDESENPSFFRLLGIFGELTGTPVLLNTSMNAQGEPIVESPADAVRFLFGCLIDAVIIENFACARSSIELDRMLADFGAPDPMAAAG